MYFSKCKTAEELKKAYREIVKKLHPDNGGDASLFKTMQQEFTAMWDRLKNIHVNRDGEQYTKETNETAQEFMDIIEKVIHLDGVEVELCGSWIWCSGNTKEHRKELLALKFVYSSTKKAWYFHYGPYRKKGYASMTMDEIRSYYGSKKFREEQATNSKEDERVALPA